MLASYASGMLGPGSPVYNDRTSGQPSVARANHGRAGRFDRPDGETRRFRHSVRLQPGEYGVRIIVYAAEAPAFEDSRRLTVPTEGLTRFDLRGARPR